MVTDIMLQEAAAEAERILLSFTPDDGEKHVFSQRFEDKMKKLLRRAAHPVRYQVLRFTAIAAVIALLFSTNFVWLFKNVQLDPGTTDPISTDSIDPTETTPTDPTDITDPTEITTDPTEITTPTETVPDTDISDIYGTCGNVFWYLDETRTVATFSGNGPILWSSSDDLQAFQSYGYRIKKVIIEEGVTSIGYRNFAGFNALRSIQIPTTMTEIQADAFLGCSISEVHISDLRDWCSIYFWGVYANPICGYTSLYLNGELVTDLVIPADIEKVGSCTFSNYKKLKSVTLLNTNTRVEAYAFWDSSITRTNYGNAVYIGNSDNPYLILEIAKSQDIPDCQIHPDTKVISDFAFEYCAGLTKITVPEGVTTLGSNAFSNCSSLVSVTLPSTVSAIQESTFSNCLALRHLDLSGSGVTVIKSRAFEGAPIQNISLPDSIQKLEDNLFSDRTEMSNYDKYLTHVYYAGSEQQWNAIELGHNEGLFKAIRHYESTINEAFDFATGLCSICEEVGCSHVWDNGEIQIPASCYLHGWANYTCIVCSFQQLEKLEKLTTHKPSSEWTTDGTHHWHECSVCHEKVDYAEHTPGAATDNQIHCNICDALLSTTPEPAAE